MFIIKSDKKKNEDGSSVTCPRIMSILTINFFCMPENITDGKTLKTCALRPAGIYGEGELRHLPRIVVSENQMTEIDCKEEK